MTCKYNCTENPDAVEKINWKCVECKTDLEAIQKTVIAARATNAKARAEEAAKNAPYALSEEEIKKRRDMY